MIRFVRVVRPALALLCLFSIFALVGCGSAATASADQNAAIEEGVRLYADQHTVPGLQYQIVVEKIEGDYAKGKLIPADPSVGTVTFYAKRESGSWRGITIGSGFLPEQFDEWGIPNSLR